MVKGPQEPSKRARWPQDAIKIHAKTSSKQFPFEFVTLRASKTPIYVQTSKAVRFSMTLGPPTCSMSLWLLACSVKPRPSRMPSDLRLPRVPCGLRVPSNFPFLLVPSDLGPPRVPSDLLCPSCSMTLGPNVGKLLAHHTGSWALWRCRRAAH